MSLANAPRVEALRGHAAMLGFSVMVAGSFSLGSRIANDIDPMALTALRFAVAAVIVAVLARLSGTLSRTTYRAPWRYLLTGGLFAAYFVLMFEGLKTAEPVATAAVFTLMPLMAAVFGWVLLRQVTTQRMATALAIGALGALWVIFDADPSAAFALEVGRGEAVYFVGSVAHALYIPAVARLSRGEGAFAFTSGVLASGALILLVIGWPAILSTDWVGLPARVWIVLAYLVVFSSVLSISALQFASLRLEAARVTAYTYLTPSVVILWEIALGGGVPDPFVLIGVGLTSLALVILLRPG